MLPSIIKRLCVVILFHVYQTVGRFRTFPFSNIIFLTLVNILMAYAILIISMYRNDE